MPRHVHVASHTFSCLHISLQEECAMEKSGIEGEIIVKSETSSTFDVWAILVFLLEFV